LLGIDGFYKQPVAEKSPGSRFILHRNYVKTPIVRDIYIARLLFRKYCAVLVPTLDCSFPFRRSSLEEECGELRTNSSHSVSTHRSVCQDPYLAFPPSTSEILPETIKHQWIKHPYNFRKPVFSQPLKDPPRNVVFSAEDAVILVSRDTFS